MKVTIRGNNPVTGDQVKSVIDHLNEKYEKAGLKVKNLTCYIRLVNEDGDIFDPVDRYGDPIDLTVDFKKTVNMADEDKTAAKKPKKRRSKKNDANLKVLPGGKST